jgi:XTP/dITP diphosphohydrolase
MKPQLLIASGNPGKIREIQALLSHLEITILSTQNIHKTNVQETGVTYSENARIKALAYLAQTGLPVLADDSGLEVDVLQGEPGIYSARFSPLEHATDADRRKHLLTRLEGQRHPWKAHFHCTAVFALPGGVIIETTGRCDGIIIPEERGSGGFGYDPVFFLPEYEATMAELPAGIKNQISHRAKAMAAMLPFIEEKLIEE